MKKDEHTGGKLLINGTTTARFTCHDAWNTPAEYLVNVNMDQKITLDNWDIYLESIFFSNLEQ